MPTGHCVCVGRQYVLSVTPERVQRVNGRLLSTADCMAALEIRTPDLIGNRLSKSLLQHNQPGTLDQSVYSVLPGAHHPR